MQESTRDSTHTFSLKYLQVSMEQHHHHPHSFVLALPLATNSFATCSSPLHSPNLALANGHTYTHTHTYTYTNQARQPRINAKLLSLLDLGRQHGKRNQFTLPFPFLFLGFPFPHVRHLTSSLHLFGLFPFPPFSFSYPLPSLIPYERTEIIV